MKLKQKLAELKRSSGSKAIPILDDVLLQDGYLITTTLDVFTRAYTGWEGQGVFSLKKLQDIVNKKGDPDKVEQRGDRIFIVYGKSEFALPLYDADDFPSLPIVEGFPFTFELTKEIKNLGKFVGKIGVVRDSLSGIYFDDNGVIVACNTHILKMVQSTVRGGITLPGYLCTLPLSIYAVRYNPETKWAEINGDSIYYYLRVIEDAYPNYRNVLPDTGSLTMELTVNRQQLIEEVETALVAAPPKFPCVNIYGAIVSGENVDDAVEYKGHLNDTTQHGDIFGFDIDGKWLLTVLNSCECEAITIKGRDSASALWVNDDTIIMPIVHKKYYG